MSSSLATSRFSFFQIALLAAVVILASLSLAYSIQGGEKIGGGNQIVAKAPGSVAISQSPYPEPRLAINPHVGAPGFPVGIRPTRFNPTPSEIPLILAQMHKNIADIRAQHGDPVHQIAELDRSHAAESVDAKWAAQSEAEILSASIQPVMTDAGLKPQGIEADCRSSTCRVSARFADASDANSWATMLVTQMGGTLSQVKMAIARQPDGSSEVRIYGARNLSPGG